MKKLNFILQSGNEIQIEKETEYIDKDGHITFNIDDYKIILANDIIKVDFCMQKEDYKLNIIGDNKEAKCTLYLNELDREMELNLTHFEYEYAENLYLIKYKIESDEDNLKTIKISL